MKGAEIIRKMTGCCSFEVQTDGWMDGRTEGRDENVQKCPTPSAKVGRCEEKVHAAMAPPRTRHARWTRLPAQAPAQPHRRPMVGLDGNFKKRWDKIFVPDS